MMLSKVKRFIKLIPESIAFGLKGADNIIDAQGDEVNSVIIKEVGGKGVFQDLLDQKETQEVKELRDEMYRVYKEADKYKVNLSMSVDEEGGVDGECMVAKASKKSPIDFVRKVDVYEDGNEVKVIQDNKKAQKHNNFDPSFLEGESLYDFDTTIEIERDGFSARFPIEKYATKIVLKSTDNEERGRFDIYVPLYSSQFSKIDALFISEMNNLYKSKTLRSDTTDLARLSFISDKCFGAEDMCKFEYDDIKYLGIEIFDGSFVLKFEGHIVEFNKDLTEKFKTKELDMKYETHAPKKNTTDLFAAKRKLDSDEDGVNLNSQVFKIGK